MDRARVLVVDDDEDVRDMLQLELSRAGVPSDSADTAEAALELMGKHNYPVVVSDIHMPGMNGVDMLAALKQRNPLAQVIMLTSDASLERVIECMDRGAIDFFAKTESLHPMVDAVNAALSRATRWSNWLGRMAAPLSVGVSERAT